MRDVYGAPYGASELAEPLITPEEAKDAQTTVCRVHKGRITHSPTDQDRPGTVFWCPIGGMYWRYSNRVTGLHAPMNFPRGL